MESKTHFTHYNGVGTTILNKQSSVRFHNCVEK